MKNRHLVSTGIIISLLASNVIIGKQYIDDSKKYERELQLQIEEIKSQTKLIKQYKLNQQELEQTIQQNTLSIEVLRDQLDKVTKEKESLEQEKQQTLSRGEVDNKRKFYVNASAYTSTCKGCSGLTFSQYDVRNTIEYNGLKIIAADLSVIPLYSIVKIDTNAGSYNAIVLDKGGAIKGYKIDLLVNTYDEAVQFGRQKVLITVLREGKG